MNGNSDPGNDIFSTRPSTAQVRAQRQKAYKEALEAQLHSRKRSMVRKNSNLMPPIDSSAIFLKNNYDF